MKRIIVGSREDVKHFQSDVPYAVISFVGYKRHRSPPRLAPDSNRLGRIVIRADDTYPGIAGTVALSANQAKRIASFVRRQSGKVDTLYIHCRFGHGRSCGAAIAVARAFGLPWNEFLAGERVGNGHITFAIARAFEELGYECGADDIAAYDRLYVNHLENGLSADRAL